MPLRLVKKFHDFTYQSTEVQVLTYMNYIKYIIIIIIITAIEFSLGGSNINNNKYT
jgi:hypothetical protein